MVESVKRKRHSWIIGLVISITALSVAVWGVQPARLLEVLEGAEYLYLIPMTGLLFLGLTTRARSWQILLNERVRFWRVFFTLNEGYLLNLVLPLKMGEIARAYLVTRGTELHFGWTTATVVLERLIDVAVCLLGLLLVLPAVVQVDWVRNIIVSVVAGLVLGIAVLYFLTRKRTSFKNLLRRIPIIRNLKLDMVIEDFVSGLGGSRQGIRILRAAFWSILAWGTNWLTLILTMRVFNLDWSFVVVLFVSGIVAFGAAIPSLPGAVGVFELSTVAGLMVFKYPQEAALSVAVLFHIHQLFITGILGAAALTRDGETISGLGEKLISAAQRKAPSES